MNPLNHFGHHQVCCVTVWVSVCLCLQNTLETCTICSKPIMERILRATGKAYHPHCFTCVVCHRSLDGIPFTVDASNHIHCIEDFHKYVNKSLLDLKRHSSLYLTCTHVCFHLSYCNADKRSHKAGYKLTQGFSCMWR